jgi:hypothetical protein
VESDDLSPNKIVARSDVLRDVEPDVAAVIVHILGSPELWTSLDSGSVKEASKHT